MELKVLQIPFEYYPDAVGGTEVYVSSLSRRLRQHGVTVEIAAPADASQEYEHEGIQVHRFGTTQVPPDVRMLYGDGDPIATREFTRVLERCAPDIVHLHAMSPAVSLSILNEVKARSIPAIFTCHIPGIMCPRGTLLRHGRNVCDGVWHLQRCTTCTLQAQGLPVLLASLLSAFPQSVGEAIAAQGFRGSPVTALRMRHLQAGRQRALEQFFGTVDTVVAVSSWLRDVMVANGVAEEKIRLCRHGSSQETPSEPARRRESRAGLRLAFLGRLTHQKGVHVLVEAMRKRPGLLVSLDIFGIEQDDAGYVDDLRKRIRGDARIQIQEPIANQEVVDRLRDYDALAVPSQCMETGPLVVYDAFLAGIPVIGSRRGGVAELVTHEGNGLLVEAGDPAAWGDALQRLASEPHLLDRLRSEVRSPRSMSEVASEMLHLYGEVISRSSAACHA
jgi:glycosyltransferase involved in cell wall biosynthesis